MIVRVWMSVSAEQLVERPESSRANDECGGLADEHDLAREEVPEAKADVQIMVTAFHVGQLDTASHRQRSHISGSPGFAASINLGPRPVTNA